MHWSSPLKIGRKLLAIVCLCILVGGLLHAKTSSAATSVSLQDIEETMYLDAVDAIARGQINLAITILEDLIEENSDFSLARLTYADLLSVKANSFENIGGEFEKSDKVAGLLDEARRRVSHFQNGNHMVDGQWPANILRLSGSQKYVVVADASQSRIHVYANTGEQLELFGDYYVSVAKNGMTKMKEGDDRTPVGVYFISSRLDPQNLDDYYGLGALPINYPNEWDQRLGRTGYGIWLHGVPTDTYSREPFASEGCLALPNNNMATLMNTLDVETTPIIIVNKLETISAQDRSQKEFEIMTFINHWNFALNRSDRESHLQYYSKDFAAGEANNIDWFGQKNQQDSSKQFVTSELADLSIFQYPEEDNLLVVSFQYNSVYDDAVEKSKVRQYWRKESDGDWRIVQENYAEFLPVHFKGIPEYAMPKISVKSQLQ